MARHSLRRRLLELAFWLGCGSFCVGEFVFAGARDPMEPRGGTFVPPPIEEPAPWKEQTTDLPPFPQDEDLVELPLDRSDYRCLIDSRTLIVGKDQAVRYTAVLVSASGARSIFFEALRCDNGEYKTEAYGRSGSFQKASAPLWRRIDDISTGSSRQFRLELRATLCDETHRPLTPTDMMKRLKYPPPSGISMLGR
ncbi:hypothetical protein CCP3SC1_140040 [Gammaproteobacteria bacterium]